MFNAKMKSLHQICCRFASWAGIFCKMTSEDEIQLRNRLLELSQSVPIAIAAAGNMAKTPAEKQRHLLDALHCIVECSRLLASFGSTASTEKALISDGCHIADGIIALLTEETSSVFLTTHKVTKVSLTGNSR